MRGNRQKAIFWMLILFAILPVQSVFAQAYKVVDADGNVTFSQYPPIEKSESSTVENVAVNDSSMAKSAVTRKADGREYCGSIVLPAERTNKYGEEYFRREVARNKEYWEKRLQDTEQVVEELNSQLFEMNKGVYNSSNTYRTRITTRYEDSKQDLLDRSKDLRCAVSWADGQLNEDDTYFVDKSEELQRLEQVHEKLIAQRTARCGEEPLLDPTNIAQTRRRENWQTCVSNFRSDIRAVEDEIRSVRRSVSY